MAVFKRIGDAEWVRNAVGVLGASYLQFVWKSSRFEYDPPNFYEQLDADAPAIIAMWHGQHFMMPFARREHRVKVLISRHRDGDINATIAERLSVYPIRGSGDHNRRFDRKGGVAAFKSMLSALQDGWMMAVTADVPKVARKAGLGIVKLAQFSGRPIVPVAVATSRRRELNNWDRSAVNLPFSRGAMVLGGAIRVPSDARPDTLEERRQAVEAELNAITARAYAIVDGRSADGA